jgi:hypothetical protein
VHFVENGAREFRAPGATYVKDAVAWGSFFGKGGEAPK